MAKITIHLMGLAYNLDLTRPKLYSNVGIQNFIGVYHIQRPDEIEVCPGALCRVMTAPLNSNAVERRVVEFAQAEWMRLVKEAQAA